MKLKNLIWSALFASAFCITFSSCEDDEKNSNDGGSKIELPGRRAYILYEGQKDTNQAGIAFYAPNKDADFQKDLFKLQNNKGLGSLAQDIIEYDDYIYVVVSGSKYITKLNEACVEVKTFEFPAGEGDPRRIEAEDGFLYVTQYGGQVSKINANTLERVAVFKGGDNLEGIAECNGKLYVANTYKNENGNWIYNEEVFVINPKTMEKEASITVVSNPERLYEVDGKVYVHSRGNYYDQPNTLQVIDPKSGNKVTDLHTPISKIAEGKNDVLYLINNETIYGENWVVVSSVNTFSTYNTRTGAFGDSFVKNLPEELVSANIYLLSVDDDTDEIYIGTTDYVSTGTIYRFGADGTFKEKFDAGGVNPNNMIFVD